MVIKKWITGVVTVAIVGGSVLVSQPADEQPIQRTYLNNIEATVIGVVDGDTIDVQLDDGTKERVRFLLVNTPESVGRYQNNPQPFGKEASQYTERELEGEVVRLEFDVEQRDPYGRLLAYVWDHGELYNQTLLEEGLAKVVVYQPNVKYKTAFQKAQREAKQKGMGLWQK